MESNEAVIAHEHLGADKALHTAGQTHTTLCKQTICSNCAIVAVLKLAWARDSLRLPRESAERVCFSHPVYALEKSNSTNEAATAMDPRVPSTRLSPEEQAPIEQFVAPAPNATYHIVEPNKGEPVVSTPILLLGYSCSPAEVDPTPGADFQPAPPPDDVPARRQVQLCRMSGESATPGGARQRDCTQIAQEVTKVGPPRLGADPQCYAISGLEVLTSLGSPTGLCVHERARLLLPTTVRPVPYRDRCVSSDSPRHSVRETPVPDSRN